MRHEVKTAIAGLAAGILISGLMAAARRSGFFHKTLAEESEDWLDRTVASRSYIGDFGTTLVEQTNHLAASAMFGSIYGTLQRSMPGVPPFLLGTFYGSALYAINIVCIAPAIGLTRGESAEPAPVMFERLAIHIVFGIAVAGFTEVWKEQNNG
jgi:hypothetical protein